VGRRLEGSGVMKKPLAVIFKSGKPKQQAIREIEKRLAALKQMERRLEKPSRLSK
jgi:hypothetical protein